MTGVRFPAGARNFSLRHHVQTGSGAYPVTGSSFPGGKADDSPPSSAKVKDCVELYLHSQYAFMAWCLVMHRGNFIFTFTLPTE
jgi:hypothetical protein